jgi:hypothetical protein
VTGFGDGVSWLPEAFEPPTLVEVGDAGHHLRPIRQSDVDLDHPAVMGSRERLWSLYGPTWGWPPETMTVEQDRDDLRYHEDEAATLSSFNYALFDEGETALLGCCYIDPPDQKPVELPEGTDAVISWWVVDELVGSDVEAALDAAVPVWIAEVWPFRQPFFGVV